MTLITSSRLILAISWPNIGPILHSLAWNLIQILSVDILTKLRKYWQDIFLYCQANKTNIGAILTVHQNYFQCKFSVYETLASHWNYFQFIAKMGMKYFAWFANIWLFGWSLAKLFVPIILNLNIGVTFHANEYNIGQSSANISLLLWFCVSFNTATKLKNNEQQISHVSKLTGNLCMYACIWVTCRYGLHSTSDLYMRA